MICLQPQMNDLISSACFRRPNEENMQSFTRSMKKFGPGFGLLQPQRFVQIAAQVMLESGEFRYDREIWDGKGAQARYDTRTDLGNTPERDGDGYLYRGRGPIMITGKSNYSQFTLWVRARYPDAPDFVANPDLVNTDPYEGLVAIWFWTTRNLNRHADKGDTKRITRRINGGYNHLAERIEYVTRLSLVTLGFDTKDVRGFQNSAGLGVDGIAGPNTKAGLHKALSAREVLIS